MMPPPPFAEPLPGVLRRRRARRVRIAMYGFAFVALGFLLAAIGA
ncbi:hypothetical protein [Stakelama pacifica]|uniref:Uncharacterized protein n=1 Tax=Stakelama pacifica TaxID=517720 RepID=A0A4R6FN28_9SPHN|nr:hypothetical protein [Stakelama pacifica]TDN83011.1 hypothetical protein EV664_105209 [Stakelama pacifica]GGO94936.1 hypothetical protein GCM10011329_17940 [Stakelama pacifica]